MNEPIERRVRVACTVAHAFAVFTDRIDAWWPRGHRRFDDSSLQLEARVGGRFYERAGDGTEAELGRVLRCEPPHLIAYSWLPGALTGPTHVEVRFAADGDATLVHVIHREGDAAMGDAWPERARLFTRAWSTVLPAFAAATETP